MEEERQRWCMEEETGLGGGADMEGNVEYLEDDMKRNMEGGQEGGHQEEMKEVMEGHGWCGGGQ